MRDLNELFAALNRSSFRRRFRLNERDARYLAARGLSTVEQHAHDFLRERLAPALPANDGRQTPLRGHPVFVAQHATATCCRKCLARWHGIPAGRPLTAEEVEHVVQAISRWLAARLPNLAAKPRADHGWLFDD